MSKRPSPPASAPQQPLLFVEHFSALADPRRHQHKVVYPLPLLLLIAVGAALCGWQDWQAAADFARLEREWLRSLCAWDEEDETPSADTLERVFGRLDAAAFRDCFVTWMREVARVRGAGSEGLQQLALDGKSVQGARDAAEPTVPLHLVHALLVDGGLLVGMEPAAGAPGEARAARGLLEVLELRECVVTGDANLLTRPLTDTILERGGQYVLALKGNRSAPHDCVRETLCAAGSEALDVRRAKRQCVSAHDAGEEVGHGREEHRRAWAFAAEDFPAVQRYLPHARSVLALVRTRAPTPDALAFAQSCETHFFLSSLPPDDAQALAGYVRAHWAVENLLHRELDVVLHEDASRIAKGTGAENWATVRRAALATLRADTHLKGSLPRRVREATLDRRYRTHLLTQVIS